MEERVLIENLSDHVDKEVTIAGHIEVRRDQGKMIFFEAYDRTGNIQCVVLPNQTDALEVGKEVSQQSAVRISGKVNKRPEKMVREGQNGDIEIEIFSIELLSKAHEMPFDIDDKELNLETLLDNRPLTLRTERGRDILKVQATLAQSFRWALIQKGFTEFQAPALVGGDAEGGSAVFEIPDYFGKKAFLATSGQLYKQIMVGVNERSMTIAKTFRAEKSATTRHLSEIVQLEFEMGFIKDHTDVMKMLESVIRECTEAVIENHGEVFERFGTEKPLLPKEEFPIFTLAEAQEIIEKEFGGKAVGEPDLEPEHERQIAQYAKEKFGSDFVFITHFPTSKRAFYTYADPENKELSLSFDLLFRGLEINSGSQRIHDYDELLEKMKSLNMDVDNFSFYLQAFKYGMPPHGGSSTGLERFTARMLELPNVKEASIFPRDMNRIDKLLSEPDE